MDVLAPGLTAVFCGINRSPAAVRAGHNFSTPSNRFWAVLHRAGFTDRRLPPEEERLLLAYGYGITAVVERATKRADDVATSEFVAARPRFEAQLRRVAPRAIAFLGKRALAAMMGRTQLDWGLQATRFAGALTWVLPNPSGLNKNFPLELLVQAYRDFRLAL